MECNESKPKFIVYKLNTKQTIYLDQLKIFYSILSIS